MYTYIYIYVHTHIYTNIMYIYIYSYIYTYRYMFVYICLYIYIYIRHRALRECVSGSCGLCLFLSYCYTYCIACSLAGKCNLDPIRIIMGDLTINIWSSFLGSKTGSVLDPLLDRSFL